MANEAISQRPRITNVNGNDLLLVSQQKQEGGYRTGAIAASEIMGKSAYYVWLEEKTTIQNYLTETTITNVLETSNVNNITELFNVTNTTEEYNDWVLTQTYNNYSNLDTYITNNNLKSEYNSWVESNNTNNEVTNMVNFIEYKNLTNDYHTYVDNIVVDTSMDKYAETIDSLQLYYNYLKTNPSATMDQFLNFLSLQTDYNNWVQEQVTNLTEDQFLQDLKGFDGTGSVLNKYTELWLTASGIFFAPTGSETPITNFGKIIIPERTFIKFDRDHRISSNNPNITVLMTGVFKVKAQDGTSATINEIKLHQNGTKIAFEPEFAPTDVVTIEAGTVVNFDYDNFADNLDTITVSLIARKVRSYSSAVNGIQLVGLWSCNDSYLGTNMLYIDESKGISTKFITDKVERFFMPNRTKAKEGFDKVYSCTVERTPSNMTLFNINNTSSVRRVLIFKSENEGGLNVGRVITPIDKLPLNAEVMSDGSFKMTLEAYED